MARKKTSRKNKKKLLIIVAALLLVLIAVGLVYYFVFAQRKQSEQEPPQKYYSMLTGVEVEQAIADKPILGVMIENSEAARPQTGLDNAGIVFEAVTEGGITRYLALYQENIPEVVGPVRSVRSHFVNWLMGFDASVAHVGGSADGLSLLQQRKARSLNQFNFPGPYYRDPSREAPHNMYARTKDLQKLQKEQSHTKADFNEIPRSDDAPNPTPQAKRITVDFSGPAFVAEFRYDAKTNAYIRYLAGEPHVDTVTKKPISVKNVVVLKAKGLASGVEALGRGEALLFKDGNVQKIRWENPSYKERIQFVSTEGGEVPLNRGQTWVMAVAADRPVTY